TSPPAARRTSRCGCSTQPPAPRASARCARGGSRSARPRRGSCSRRPSPRAIRDSWPTWRATPACTSRTVPCCSRSASSSTSEQKEIAMKRTHARFAAWAGALLSLLLAVDGAVAATATPNVSAASTSEPKLDATGTAWAPFGNALGAPNASKSIRVLYLADDVSVYPLDASSAAVQLRPGPSPGTMPVNCTYSTTEPVLDASNGGSCTFRMISTAGNVDTLEVFHLGLLSGAMRLTRSEERRVGTECGPRRVAAGA